MKLLVLDGNSLVNRAFFGIKVLTTKDGRYTNAIYGFQNILLNLLSAHKPDAVAIAWDEKAPTFRHNAYDGYKATRHGMPQELAEQMPALKQLLADLGFAQVSKAGWEADDILGTLAAANEAQGGATLLATGDRDSLQLVDKATTVLLATNRETLTMDEDAIREKYGVTPPQLIEVKSLMGDSSDNIPGVAGIGEKTALSLVQKFGSLAGVYENIDDKAIKPKQRENLLNHRQEAEMSRMLGTIRKDAPIETDPAAYARTAGRTRRPPPSCWPTWRCTSWPNAGAWMRPPPSRKRRWPRWRPSRCRWLLTAGILWRRFPQRTAAAPGTRCRRSRNRLSFAWTTRFCPLCWTAAPRFGPLTQSLCTAGPWPPAAWAGPSALTASWLPTC